MKKNIIIIISIAIILFGDNMLGFSQGTDAKKPILMVVPSDNWCISNGYFIEYDNQGKTDKMPDYKRALQENSDLLLAITKIGEIMTERKFNLQLLEEAIKTLESENAENAILTSKSGAGVSESPIDKLKKTAKADIWLQISWTINQIGPRKSITFSLVGKDAYTGKQIAASSGTSNELIGISLPLMLETAVLDNIENFNSQLMLFSQDITENGREIVINIKKFDSWDGDLEKEYDGKELNSYIEEWLTKNCVKGSFNTSEATENMMIIKQVRIPKFNEAGVAIDAKSFCKGLQNYLKKEPFLIVNKLMTKGLGQATIMLGEK
jgi:hypothetical protein